MLKRTALIVFSTVLFTNSSAVLANSVCEQYNIFYLSLPKELPYDQVSIIDKALLKYPDLNEEILYTLSDMHKEIVKCDNSWSCDYLGTQRGTAKYIKRKCEEGTLYSNLLE